MSLQAKEQSIDASVGLDQLSIDDMEVDVTSPIVISDDSDNEDDDGGICDGFVDIKAEATNGSKNVGAGVSVSQGLEWDSAPLSNRKRLGPPARPPVYPSKDELNAAANATPKVDFINFQLRSSWKKAIRQNIASTFQNLQFKKDNLACQSEAVDIGVKIYVRIKEYFLDPENFVFTEKTQIHNMDIINDGKSLWNYKSIVIS
ncbi:uncharacterized protein J8A68_003637 [[Candida] subhashii]|uniref:Uncharacterized protein n=1 Tax=[Candida] subhashii TaxID=561895 RepID=A0A8J5UM27_9ASCO|nr:uncharacterized protein J8A68_003637 [[Candida] subhashii]KAG7662867.1 hypothetical protein J8A68_003637 [[Candida] subhashii]